jgi:hypothetical protein
MPLATLHRRKRVAAATAVALATIGLPCLAPSASTLKAQEPAAGAVQPAKSGWSDERIAELIGRHGSASTFAALAIDVAALDPQAVATAVRRVVTLTPEEDRQMTEGLRLAEGKLEEVGIQEIVFLGSVDPVRQTALVAIVRLEDRADAEVAAQFLREADFRDLDEAEFDGDAMVLSSSKDGGVPPVPLSDVEPIRQALAAAGDAPIRAALFLSPDLRRVVGELAFALGDEQAIQGAKLAARELQFATLALNPSEEMSVDLTVRFATQEGAARGADLAQAAITRLRKNFPERETIPLSDETLDRIAEWLTPEVAADSSDLVLHRSLKDEETLTLFRDAIAPSIVAARAQADRMTNSNKFKQVAIAFHNFHDSYRILPLAGNQKKDGKAPGLSWRVHLLPFLEQNELYKKFRLDEPWDSAHNKALIAEMPDVYKLDPSVPQGKTTMLLPMGAGYGFSGEEPGEFRQFTDGLSNTIMVLQAAPAEAVTWTKPEDLEVDLSEFPEQVGAEGEETFLAARFDGSVQSFWENAAPETLNAILTRAGGEVVEPRAALPDRPEPPARAPADRSSNETKFKYLGLAFHNFHDTHKMFPLAGEQTVQGKRTGLSWRVHLLPYIEGGMPLYQKFALDEPWDSAHNKPLIAEMPAIYKLDPKAPAGKTVALLPMGEGYGFSGALPTGIRDVTDGTSNTIAVVQASAGGAVIWTKPEDLEIDLSEFADQLGAEGEKTFLVLMFDGRVLRLDESIDEEKLKAALTRAGGENVTLR